MKKKRTKKPSSSPPPRRFDFQEPAQIVIKNNRFVTPEPHTAAILDAAKVTASALLENAKGLVAVAEVLKRAGEPLTGLKIANSSNVMVKDCVFRSGKTEV